MAAPALKDLPKVAVDLKSQLESFSTDQLKNASTEEKALLPTAEGKRPSTHTPIRFHQALSKIHESAFFCFRMVH